MNNSSDVSQFISRLPLANGVVVDKWENNEYWNIKGENAIVTITAVNSVLVWVDSGRDEDIDKTGDWPFGHTDLETKILDALMYCGLL
jgi:hypothetical protein